ncbi:MAG: 4Fe-4S dicluster domain-containing protein [Armatimonadota bacterium]|jgi:sulfhydrogenase subunit beta (sulfur reductase)
MRNYTLDKDTLTKLLARIVEQGRVLAPVRRGRSAFVFDQVREPGSVALDYVRTILPPKKAFLVPPETVVGSRAQPVMDELPWVLFAVHPCDLAAIARLDWALEGNGRAPAYFARREAATIVGIDCMPDEHCFCTSMRTDGARDGADLFLTPIEDGYVVEVLTEKGETLLHEAGAFRDASAGELCEAERWAREKARRATPYVDVIAAELPESLERQYDSEAWDRVVQSCCNCGTCTIVCPTCYCFELDDELNFACTAGRRSGRDSCRLADLAPMAGARNFGEARMNRVRHRFLHKFRHAQLDYGRPFCTGCGRCSEACVARLSPTDVVGLMATQGGRG